MDDGQPAPSTPVESTKDDKYVFKVVVVGMY